jgi:hypothetical protein
MEPYAGVDYITSPYVHYRVDSNSLKHIYHGHWATLCQNRPLPYARVDFIPVGDFGFGLCPLLGLCSVSVSIPRFTSPLQTNTAHPHSP